MKKLINFKCHKLVRMIQDHANKNFDGNFTEAVVSLCLGALNAKDEK